MIILGINAYHPDASVALLKDGVLLWAAEEERYSRVKHASGFPRLALKRCLEETGTPPLAIDAVAISKNPRANLLRKTAYVLANRPQARFVFDRLKAFRKASQFEEDFFDTVQYAPPFLKSRFMHVEHHQAHAASSFFVSGFDRAAFLTVDGLGDFSSCMWGLGERNKLTVYDRVYFPHSAGFLYTAATQFLGFHRFGDEYKVMGLAAYGKPAYLDTFRDMVRFKRGGQFELNLSYFLHQEGQAKVRWEGGVPEQDILYSQKWTEAFGMTRWPEEPITEREQNIAASLQTVLEEIYFHMLGHLYERTQERNLCLAGGCAFNSVANGKVTKNTPFQNVYIQPAAGDAGTALGAAAFVAHAVFNEPRHFVMDHAAFGTSASDLEIEGTLKGVALSHKRLSEDELVEKTVQSLVQGQIVGWFQGRMEFGPRALGQRSILADPRRAHMKDVLNHRVKHRESFRPFAPAVPEEKAMDYFEMDCASSPFMLKVFPVRTEKKAVIPAVTHVDGSARVQTVNRDTQPLFWKLLTEFGKQTGVPVLLNTSFNENEPIVCTSEEALECFLKTKMDVLVMGNYFVEKNKIEP